MRLKTDAHFDLLLETLTQAKDRQYPWIEKTKAVTEQQQMEEYEEMYERVTAEYREYARALKELESAKEDDVG